MPTARNQFSGGSSVGGKIYAIGGLISGLNNTTAVEEYNPAEDNWTNCGGSCSTLPTARHSGTSAVVNGKIYVIGGYNQASSSYQTTVEEFDPAIDTWTNCGGACAAMPTGRNALTSVVYNGRIFVFGGEGAGGALDIVEEYDPSTNTWTNCGSGCTALPAARLNLSSVIVNGKVYVIGGLDGASRLNTVEEYDPASDSWTNCSGGCADMPNARDHFSAITINGKIYVVGGQIDGGTRVATVEEFDPATNTWSNCGGNCAEMSGARIAMFGAVDDGRGYVIGGGDASGNDVGTVEAFTPPGP